VRLNIAKSFDDRFEEEKQSKPDTFSTQKRRNLKFLNHPINLINWMKQRKGKEKVIRVFENEFDPITDMAC
jgi:hypothetical protein